MPQSLSAVYIHLVFSTKSREAFLSNREIRTLLHRQLGGISKRLECPPWAIGGVSDHVHLLCRLGRTITQAEWVKELKRVSNLWLKEQGGFDTFSGQLGLNCVYAGNPFGVGSDPTLPAATLGWRPKPLRG